MTWVAALVVAVGVLVVDQVAKTFVMSRPSVILPAERYSFVSIQRVLSRSGPVSILGRTTLVALWAVLAAAAAAALYVGLPAEGAIGIGAILGGAAGNLADRLRRGTVIDFIAIGPWPVFNIADAAIVGGIGLVLVALR
jgi:signal peptidase II